MAKDFNYEIVKQYGVLSDKNGWTKELNFVSYNGASPKFDIRTWSVDPESGEKRMSKGITLSIEEVKKLRELLEDIELPE